MRLHECVHKRQGSPGEGTLNTDLHRHVGTGIIAEYSGSANVADSSPYIRVLFKAVVCNNFLVPSGKNFMITYHHIVIEVFWDDTRKPYHSVGVEVFTVKFCLLWIMYDGVLKYSLYAIVNYTLYCPSDQLMVLLSPDLLVYVNYGHVDYSENTPQYSSTTVPFFPLSAELSRSLYSLISSRGVTRWPCVGFIRSISHMHTHKSKLAVSAALCCTEY